MTNRLPNADLAVFDIRKLAEYCLNPLHPRGRHKARVFREALSLERGDAVWLRNTLLVAAQSAGASLIGEDAWGAHWRLDATIERHDKHAMVRSIWIVRTGESRPTFVTCWVL
jgi:hypothetical protein